MSDDSELLQRIRAGAMDEFAELVRRHQSRVFAILYRYERDAQRMEDLAQETFLKAWRALDQFDGRAPFEHWISRIAVRTALDHLRKEKRHKSTVGFDDLGEDTLDWLRSDDQKNELQVRGAAELLNLAMQELAPGDRVLITQLELENRSIKEIAATLNISSIAVRVRGVRARARLKQALEKSNKRGGAKPSDVMDEKKIKQLFATARSEKPPEPGEDFATEVLRAVRREPTLKLALTFSLFDQLNRLFPRLATLAAAIILLCVAGDFIGTLTGLPEVGDATAQMTADNFFDTEDL